MQHLCPLPATYVCSLTLRINGHTWCSKRDEISKPITSLLIGKMNYHETVLVWLVWLTKKALKLELQSLNVVFLKKPFQNQSSKKTLYKYDYYTEMGGTPVNFFFRSHTKINFMTKVGTSQLYDWHILSKEGTVHTKKCFTLSLTHNDLSEIPYRIAIIPIFWVKKPY